MLKVCSEMYFWNFTIKFILDLTYVDGVKTFRGLNIKQFCKMLNWACKETELQFEDQNYLQIDGLAMGSP